MHFKAPRAAVRRSNAGRAPAGVLLVLISATLFLSALTISLLTRAPVPTALAPQQNPDSPVPTGTTDDAAPSGTPPHRSADVLVPPLPPIGPRSQRLGSPAPHISAPSPQPAAAAATAQPLDTDNEAGTAAYEAGHYHDAVQAFERALARQPDNPTFRHNMAAATAALGWAAIKDHDPDEAIRQFHTAIDYDRREASLYAGLGTAYQLQRDSTHAIEAFRAAVALDPTRIELYEQLADLLYQRNQLADAIALLTSAMQRVREPDRLAPLLAKMTKEQSLQNRFLQTGTRHFLIQFDGGDNRDRAYQILDLLELAYRDVGQAFGVFPDEEITVILYSNEQFRDVTQTPGWTNGVYDGKIRLPAGGGAPDRALLAKVLYHEYTHVIVHELSDNLAPTWLNEGLAVYFEGLASGNLPGSQEVSTRSLARLSPSGLIPLEALHGSFLEFTSDQAAVAYAESYSATRYLINRYGLPRVKELLQQLSAGRPFDQTFETVFFLPYQEFERSWQATLTS
ncbi:MAG TPA: tetratricopeptide repeat protein [Nitrospiria bacterium]|nr:tetratricopeptide repeat protein [Nitrospiria bacterium]